jgi:hypothetical protein
VIQKILGHYRVLAKLGEGGMGEVYRATDMKLGRDVAIKVLPAAVAQDADRVARFEREARLPENSSQGTSRSVGAPGRSATMPSRSVWVETRSLPSGVVSKMMSPVRGPVLSRDGRSLLFTDQSRLAGPNYSVYFQGADGSPPVRLGEGQGVDFSPDGASVLVVVMADPPRLMIYPTRAGEPRDISAKGFVSYDYLSTRFLPDGRGVAFCGSESGKASRCYVRDLAGGAARP